MIKSIYISTIGLLMGFVLLSSSAASAQVNTSYFMRTNSLRAQFNPALRPDQNYLGVPFLNNIYADVKTNTFVLENFVFPQSNGPSLFFMNSGIGSNEFLKNISTNNYAALDVNYSIFSMGFYNFDSRGFWTIDVGIKSQTNVNLPKDLFSFLKIGFDDNSPVKYNLKETRVTSTAYLEAATGYSRTFLEENNLTVGLRLKFLMGMGNADMRIRNLTLNAGMDEWTLTSHGTLDISAPVDMTATFDEDGRFDGIETSGSAKMGSYGLGFDIGASYTLLDNRLTLSAAATDIGFILWGKNNTLSLYSNLDETTVAGDFDIDFNDEESMQGQLDAITDKLEDIYNFRETENSRNRSTSLRTNLIASAEYEIVREKLLAGLLSTTHFNAAQTVTELTFSGVYRPADWFEFALSYSFMHSKFNTFGTAISLAPGKGVKLFLAGDYVLTHVNPDWIPVSSKGLNFQFGLAIPMGLRHAKYSTPETVPTITVPYESPVNEDVIVDEDVIIEESM